MSKDLQVGNDDGLRVATATRAAGDPGPADALTAAAAALAAADATALHPASDPGPELDNLERRAWRAYLYKHALVARLLEADLVARSNLPLAEFDVLFQIAMTDGQRLRMNELADRVVLSRAGITRLVDRLVEDGLVERVKCASDARGAFAALTDRGRERLEEARPKHLAAVKRFLIWLDANDYLQVLAELMERGVPLD